MKSTLYKFASIMLGVLVILAVILYCDKSNERLLEAQLIVHNNPELKGLYALFTEDFRISELELQALKDIITEDTE